VLEIERGLSGTELEVREAGAAPFFWPCFAVHNHGRDSVARLVSAPVPQRTKRKTKAAASELAIGLRFPPLSPATSWYYGIKNFYRNRPLVGDTAHCPKTVQEYSSFPSPHTTKLEVFRASAFRVVTGRILNIAVEPAASERLEGLGE
jgi:hypothetical protein